MRFVLMARQRSSGEVRLITGTAYPSREDAIDALASEAAPAAEGEDLFVVDLEAVTPVLLLGNAGAAPAEAREDTAEAEAEAEAAAEPIADAWEAPEEDGEELADEGEQPPEDGLRLTAGEAAWEAALAEELSGGSHGEGDQGAEGAVEEGADEPAEAAAQEATDEPAEAAADEATDEPAEAAVDEATEEQAEDAPAQVSAEAPEEDAGARTETETGAEAEPGADETAADEQEAEAPPEEAFEAVPEVPPAMIVDEDEPWEDPRPVASDAAVEEDLASALRRAATSMEDAGIVAPPSVEEFAAAAVAEEAVVEQPPVEQSVFEQPPVEQAAVDQPLEGSAEEDSGAVAVEEHADMWPWEAEAAEMTQASAATPVDQTTEELLAALESVAGPAPTPAPEALPEPDHADVPSIEEVAEQGFGPVSEGAIAEYLSEEGAQGTPDAEGAEVAPYVPVGIEEAGAEEISLLTPAEPASLTIAGPEDAHEAPAGAEAAAHQAGEGGIESYTCDDCVYVSTCPKNHQDSPATCGTFQWKPV